MFEQVGNEKIIRAIRIGGYPEMVRALSDAIYAGCTFDAEIMDETHSFKSESKRYERQISHDGVYAEATLLGRDDDQKTKSNDGDENNGQAQGEPRQDTDFLAK